jgi:hypothetical protein
MASLVGRDACRSDYFHDGPRMGVGIGLFVPIPKVPEVHANPCRNAGPPQPAPVAFLNSARLI